jgi:hypothetical protein
MAFDKEAMSNFEGEDEPQRIFSFESLEALNITLTNDQEILPSAPALSYDKFVIMQQKRVVVTIRYSGSSNLRPLFLTAAKKIKAAHPDVVIGRRILPKIDEEEETVFDISVDGKLVAPKSRARKQKGRAVFVSMQEMDHAISRARRRRRPSSTYGDDEENRQLQIRLQNEDNFN